MRKLLLVALLISCSLLAACGQNTNVKTASNETKREVVIYDTSTDEPEEIDDGSDTEFQYIHPNVSGSETVIVSPDDCWDSSYYFNIEKYIEACGWSIMTNELNIHEIQKQTIIAQSNLGDTMTIAMMTDDYPMITLEVALEEPVVYTANLGECEFVNDDDCYYNYASWQVYLIGRILCADLRTGACPFAESRVPHSVAYGEIYTYYDSADNLISQ